MIMIPDLTSLHPFAKGFIVVFGFVAVILYMGVAWLLIDYSLDRSFWLGILGWGMLALPLAGGIYMMYTLGPGGELIAGVMAGVLTLLALSIVVLYVLHRVLFWERGPDRKDPYDPSQWGGSR